MILNHTFGLTYLSAKSQRSLISVYWFCSGPPEFNWAPYIISIWWCNMERLVSSHHTTVPYSTHCDKDKMSAIVQKCIFHDDVIKWKHFPPYWPFVRGIHQWLVNSPHEGQWRGALIFSLIRAWINGWVNNREAGDLRRHGTHYDVTVMLTDYDWTDWNFIQLTISQHWFRYNLAMHRWQVIFPNWWVVLKGFSCLYINKIQVFTLLLYVLK